MRRLAKPLDAVEVAATDRQWPQNDSVTNPRAKPRSSTRAVPQQVLDGGRGVKTPTKTNEIEPLLDADDVAKRLGVSSSWLAKSRLDGTGPRFIKIGRAVRYAPSAVREFILRHQRNSTSET
jgi:predicted DNA-binding transcriptional regulator AlpA